MTIGNLLLPRRSSTISNLGGTATHPATAHIPGLGPVGAICAACTHYQPTKRKHRRKGRCWLWSKFRGLTWRWEETFREDYPFSWWQGLPTIGGITPACKYFEEKHLGDSQPDKALQAPALPRGA